MTTGNFTIEDLAKNLIHKLDRGKIFPPYYDNPEIFIAKLLATTTSYPTVSSTPTTDTNSSTPTTLITKLKPTNLMFRKPKRPQNAFLLCRKNVHQEAKRIGSCNMRIISKVTGIMWKNASAQEKQVYERLADRVNEIQNQRYLRETNKIQQQHQKAKLRIVANINENRISKYMDETSLKAIEVDSLNLSPTIMLTVCLSANQAE
nr:11286_t:CDS:2 [Entrophospora candida]